VMTTDEFVEITARFYAHPTKDATTGVAPVVVEFRRTKGDLLRYWPVFYQLFTKLQTKNTLIILPTVVSSGPSSNVVKAAGAAAAAEAGSAAEAAAELNSSAKSNSMSPNMAAAVSSAASASAPK